MNDEQAHQIAHQQQASQQPPRPPLTSESVLNHAFPSPTIESSQLDPQDSFEASHKTKSTKTSKINPPPQSALNPKIDSAQTTPIYKTAPFESTSASASTTTTTVESEPVILMVDDQDSNLQSLEALLEREHQHIVSVRSGTEALKFLLKNEAAVILLDVHMPQMDGFETAHLIRNRKQSEHTPIIFITAENRTAEKEVEAYRLGAVDFIFKPIIPHILKSKVSVFVDLYKKNERIKQQQTEIFLQQQQAQEKQIKALREAQLYQKTLLGWNENTVTAQLAGVGPLRERCPEVLEQLELNYENLLDDYLEALGFGIKPPRHEIEKIANQIGQVGGGPRDLVDLHIRVVTQKGQNVHPKRAHAYAIEGRLLAIQAMGYLVDFYRNTRHQTKLASKESE